MKKKLSTKMAVYIGALVLVVALGLGFTANYFASDTVTEEAEKSITRPKTLIIFG
jgi:Zn finger protein HypA/HybF involved in hydrogenase expression